MTTPTNKFDNNFYEDLHPLLTGEEEDELTEPEDFLLPTREQLDAKVAAEAEAEAKPKTPDEPVSQDEVTPDAAQTTLFTAEVDDPGEFKPADYSFEVQVFDDKNANPKTVKINSPADFDKLLEDESNFGSAVALLKAQRLTSTMEASQKSDAAKHAEKLSAYQADQARADAANATVTAMENGLNYLVGKGELPPVDGKYLNADWTDPEIAKQDGVKEQLELIAYMDKENKARTKAGLPAFASIVDAYQQMDREQARKAIKSTADNAGDARRQAGMRVAASAPAPVSAMPKGVSVGRSFGSLDNIG